MSGQDVFYFEKKELGMDAYKDAQNEKKHDEGAMILIFSTNTIDGFIPRGTLFAGRRGSKTMHFLLLCFKTVRRIFSFFQISAKKGDLTCNQ
jgi:hypothetical protein